MPILEVNSVHRFCVVSINFRSWISLMFLIGSCRTNIVLFSEDLSRGSFVCVLPVLVVAIEYKRLTHKSWNSGRHVWDVQDERCSSQRYNAVQGQSHPPGIESESYFLLNAGFTLV